MPAGCRPARRAARNGRPRTTTASGTTISWRPSPCSPATRLWPARSSPRRRGADRAQVAADGGLPEELKRTRALHYSYFALEPLVGLADLGRCVGVDVWGYQTKDGRGLRKALGFLAPYVGREASFPHKELNPAGAAGEGAELFTLAAWAYGDADFAKAAAVSAEASPNALERLLIAPYEP